MKSISRYFLCVASCLLISVSLVRADWPGFLGPTGSNVATASGLAKSWPASGPKVLWTVPVEPGFAVPVVFGQDLYFMERFGNQQDGVRCLDLSSGEERWRFAYDARGNLDYEGARAQPAVDERYLFIAGPFGHVHCLDRSDGKVVWSKNLAEMYRVEQPRWAFAASPLLYKDTVILAPLGKSVGLVALAKHSGDVVWESPALPEQPGKRGYASPILVAIGGTDHAVLNTSKGVSGVDAGSGALAWSSEDWQCRIPVASCFPVGEGRVFVSGGYDAGSALFRIERMGEEFKVVTEWKSDVCKGQIQPPVLHEGYLYLNANDKAKNTGFMCLALDGTVQWSTGTEPGFDWGGTVLADGMIYVVDGDVGDICLVQPDPAGYREVARFHCLEGDRIWGQILIANGKLLLRDQTTLVCIELPKSAALIHETIEKAIAVGDLEDVKRHVASDPARINQGSHPTMTPLHQAILRKKTEIAIWLIDAGADVDRADGSGRTPLHLAVERGDAAMVRALMVKQVRPNELDKTGWTPLHHATAGNKLEVTRALLEGGADPMTRSARGGTALHEAAASGGPEIIQLVLDHGVDPAVKADSGVTALDVAREMTNKSAIAILSDLAK